MDKQPGVGERRLRETSNARRPDIALELARTIATCTAAQSLVGRRCRLSTAEAVDAATDALGSRTTGEFRDVIVDAVAATGFGAARKRLDEAATRFATACDLDGHPIAVHALDTPAGALAALRSAGFAADSLDAPALKHLADEPTVKALGKLLDAQDLVGWVSSGALRRSLVAAYDSVLDTPGTLDDVIGTIAGAGYDGERLCWAAITFETHSHIRLVWHQANKLARTFPDRRAADLFGWGWQGLRVSLRQYDPQRCAFSTYACTRISGSIRDGVRSESPIPKRLTTYVRKVAKAEEDLTQELGRAPHLAEVADHLGERLEQLKIMPRLVPSASIEEMSAASGERGDLAWLADDTDPAESAIGTACADAIEAALATLPEDEATAVRLLLYEGVSVPEARAITGATARQLRQRCNRAKEHLARELSDWQELVPTA